MPDQTAVPRATNVLAAMAGAVTAQRAAKGARLTPVAGERPAAPLRMPDLPTEFMPQEGIEQVVRNIRVEAAKLIQIADNIDASLGNVPPDQAPDPIAAQKATERAADAAAAERNFAADFAAQQAAAQAATFTDPKEAQRAAIRAAIAALDA